MSNPYRSDSAPGASVQFSFSGLWHSTQTIREGLLKRLGTSVQASLYLDDAGANALLYVDGQIATVINTLKNGTIAFDACEITTGSSGPLSDGVHTVMMVNNRSTSSDTAIVAIYFISFA